MIKNSGDYKQDRDFEDILNILKNFKTLSEINKAFGQSSQDSAHVERGGEGSKGDNSNDFQ